MSAKPGRVGRLRKRIRSTVADVRSRLYVDRSDSRRTVFLLSSGRSGSTWLSALLQSIPATRTIFEPFHPVHGNSTLAPYRYRYISEQDDDRELDAALGSILDGTLRSPWSDQFNPILPVTFKRRLVKEVRANLLAPWLTRKQPDAKFIFLVRHPIPVAFSQLKGGWKLSSRRLLEQEQLIDESGLKALSKFGWPDSGFESLILFWAIENSVALQSARNAGAEIVRYEDLVLQPQQTLEKIEKYIEADFPNTVWKRFDKSSWSSRRTVGDLSPAEKVNRWRRDASDAQVAFVAEVLNTCELGSLYDASSITHGD